MKTYAIHVDIVAQSSSDIGKLLQLAAADFTTFPPEDWFDRSYSDPTGTAIAIRVTNEFQQTFARPLDKPVHMWYDGSHWWSTRPPHTPRDERR